MRSFICLRSCLDSCITLPFFCQCGTVEVNMPYRTGPPSFFPAITETERLDVYSTSQGDQEEITAQTYTILSRSQCRKSFVAAFFIIIIVIIISSLTARVVGAPEMISQPVSSTFSVIYCPLGLYQFQACPFSDVVFPPLPLSALSFPPFAVPCKMVLARPDERETWPYHCSLRLFTMVMRSSCGLIACWIMARTFSLVTWSLYEMRSISSTSLPWLAFFFGVLLWGTF